LAPCNARGFWRCNRRRPVAPPPQRLEARVTELVQLAVAEPARSPELRHAASDSFGHPHRRVPVRPIPDRDGCDQAPVQLMTRRQSLKEQKRTMSAKSYFFVSILVFAVLVLAVGGWLVKGMKVLVNQPA
jgi:hypothetical protein